MKCKTEAQLDQWLIDCAKLPAHQAANFTTASGFWAVLDEAFSVGGDLYDVIELCRAAKLYTASDRLRTLQARLLAAADELHFHRPQPRLEVLVRMAERQDKMRGDLT